MPHGLTFAHFALWCAGLYCAGLIITGILVWREQGRLGYQDPYMLLAMAILWPVVLWVLIVLAVLDTALLLAGKVGPHAAP